MKSQTQKAKRLKVARGDIARTGRQEKQLHKGTFCFGIPCRMIDGEEVLGKKVDDHFREGKKAPGEGCPVRTACRTPYWNVD